MSLRDLTTQTMVSIVSAWLDPARERQDIEALAKAAFLLPTLEEAKNALLQIHSTTPSTLPTAINAVQKEQAEVDDIHDRKSRGVHGALTAFADMVDDPNHAARLIALRERLFPQGLAVIKWSYIEEAGEAELVESRLTDDDRTLLKQLPYPGGKLFDVHQSRIDSARKLGELEQKKQALIQAHESKEGKVALADVAKARNGWIRAVRAFLGVMELERDLSPRIRHKILGQLHECERNASKRGGKDTAEMTSFSAG